MVINKSFSGANDNYIKVIIAYNCSFIDMFKKETQSDICKVCYKSVKSAVNFLKEFKFDPILKRSDRSTLLKTGVDNKIFKQEITL